MFVVILMGQFALVRVINSQRINSRVVVQVALFNVQLYARAGRHITREGTLPIKIENRLTLQKLRRKYLKVQLRRPWITALDLIQYQTKCN